MNFTSAFAEYGPDVPKLAEVLGISEPDADRLKNYMMDHKPLPSSLERKYLNKRARQMAKVFTLREIRGRHA
jgi:hypothetical protein